VYNWRGTKIQYPIIFKHPRTSFQIFSAKRSRNDKGAHPLSLNGINRSTEKKRRKKNEQVEELVDERMKDEAKNNRATCLRGRKEEKKETGPGIKIFERRARKILSRA